MHKHTKHSILAIFCLAPATVAWMGPVNGLALQPQSRLWVEGTSTVRGFECKATGFSARVSTSGANAAGAVAAGEKAVTTVELRVPAQKMDCANGTMNEHMLKALKSAEHPEIVFRLTSYELARGGSGAKVTMNGNLTLGGVQKPVSITAEARDVGGGLLQVVGSHEVRMTEFGLKPPSLMMGTMKVNERIKVNFDLFLKA